jgi:hypothetical protein
VVKLCNAMQVIIRDEDPDLIIIQIMDNSTFYVRKEDGSRQLPVVKEDGTVHLDGELQVRVRDIQNEHLRALRPLIEAAGKKSCVWVAPMPRYIAAGCCGDPTHALNRRDEYFREEMEVQLEAFKRITKDFIYNMKKKNVKVADPNLDIRGMTAAEIWGGDPIYLQEEAVKKMVDGFMLMAAKIDGRKNESTTQQQYRGRGRARGGGWADQHGRGRFEDLRSRIENESGRWSGPGNAYSGRGHRGGHQDYRARPY